MVGQTLGHYRIESKLGQGGMGEVYRAHDEILDRDIAVKVVAASIVGDEAARLRFRKEALALSRLNHPNISTLHEIGEAGGQVFLAMEYVEGRPMRELAAEGRLPVDTVLRYGVQMAAALAHAHGRGIVHRDLKSANVMVTPEGRIKLLDFGLAGRMSQAEADQATRSMDSLTQPGAVMGTLHYMAPEVLRGEAANARSDVWALGVVLHEMVAGELPFRGQTGFEVSDAILNQPPVPPPERVSPGLQAVIGRCLAKAPGERYQRADEVRAALEALQSSGPVVASVPRRRQLLVLWAALALSFLIAAALAWRFRTATEPEIDAIAVLPFVNVGSDPDTEYLSDGITESILNSLSQLRQLRVVPRSTVFQYKGREIDPQAVGRKLQVRVVLMGRVSQRGDVLSVQAELVDVAGRSQLWGERYDQKVSDILRVEQAISRRISENLRLTLTREDRSRVAAQHTGDPEAHRLYLNGRYQWNKRTREGLYRGVEYFNEAIKRDPNYALAYAGLAYSYLTMGHQLYSIMDPRESYPKAKVAAMKAVQLDETLAEAHSALGDVKFRHDWDWTGAEEEHRRAIELNPTYSSARQLYSHYLLPAGRVEESLVESKQALLLEPISLAINLHLGWHYLYSRQTDQAVEQLQKTLEIDPAFAVGLCFLGQAYEQKGMYREAIAAFEKAVSRSKDNPTLFAALGHGYALAGQRTKAGQVLQQLKEWSRRSYVSSYEIAVVYAGLGEEEQSLEWLGRACDLRDSTWLVDLKADPRFYRLHAQPKFRDLVRRIGIP